jgi:hypothetical protein
MPGTKDVGANITELRKHGSKPRPEKQILAIALSQARKAGADIPPPNKSKPRKLRVRRRHDLAELK